MRHILSVLALQFLMCFSEDNYSVVSVAAQRETAVSVHVSSALEPLPSPAPL